MFFEFIIFFVVAEDVSLVWLMGRDGVVINKPTVNSALPFVVIKYVMERSMCC